MQNKNNQVTIVGQVIEINFSHVCKGENFYRLLISTSRKSGIVDNLPVIVSEILLDLQQVVPGCILHIDGEYRSWNQNGKLVLFIFAQGMYMTDENEDNAITLNGYICRQPVYRETPSGREIADMIIATHRNQYEKSDYLPCICWGRNAQYVSVLPVGTRLFIRGRVQSREYNKIINNENQLRIAYEVSASFLKVIELGRTGL